MIERVALPVLCTLCVLASAVGCDDAFATPSAFDAEVDLCDDDPEGELHGALDDCEQEQGQECGGVLSFRGKIDGRPVAVTSELLFTVRVAARVGDPETLVLNEVQANGEGPYFRFQLKMKTVGGTLESSTDARTLTVSRGAGTADDPLADDLVDFSLRLEAGGESAERPAKTGGEVRFDRQEADEIDGSFDIDLQEPGDHLDGCFLLRGTETRVGTL